MLAGIYSEAFALHASRGPTRDIFIPQNAFSDAACAVPWALQQPNLRPGLQTVLKLAGVVEAVQNWQLPGTGGGTDAKDDDGGSKEDDGRARAGEEDRRCMKESEEQLQQYKPRIPGTVLYVYRFCCT